MSNPPRPISSKGGKKPATRGGGGFFGLKASEDFMAKKVIEAGGACHFSMLPDGSVRHAVEFKNEDNQTVFVEPNTLMKAFSVQKKNIFAAPETKKEEIASWKKSAMLLDGVERPKVSERILGLSNLHSKIDSEFREFESNHRRLEAIPDQDDFGDWLYCLVWSNYDKQLSALEAAIKAFGSTEGTSEKIIDFYRNTGVLMWFLEFTGRKERPDWTQESLIEVLYPKNQKKWFYLTMGEIAGMEDPFFLPPAVMAVQKLLKNKKFLNGLLDEHNPKKVGEVETFPTSSDDQYRSLWLKPVKAHSLVPDNAVQPLEAQLGKPGKTTDVKGGKTEQRFETRSRGLGFVYGATKLFEDLRVGHWNPHLGSEIEFLDALIPGASTEIKNASGSGRVACIQRLLFSTYQPKERAGTAAASVAAELGEEEKKPPPGKSVLRFIQENVFTGAALCVSDGYLKPVRGTSILENLRLRAGVPYVETALIDEIKKIDLTTKPAIKPRLVAPAEKTRPHLTAVSVEVVQKFVKKYMTTFALEKDYAFNKKFEEMFRKWSVDDGVPEIVLSRVRKQIAKIIKDPDIAWFAMQIQGRSLRSTKDFFAIKDEDAEDANASSEKERLETAFLELFE